MSPDLEQTYREIVTDSRSGEPDRVFRAADAAERLPPPEVQTAAFISGALMESGFALEQLGYKERSLALYNRLANYREAVPDIRGNAEYRAGAILDGLGRREEALEWLQRAAQSDAAYVQRAARSHIASVLCALGRHEDAGVWLEPLVEAEGANPAEATVQLGITLLQTRSKARGLALLRGVAASKAQSSLRGTALLHLGHALLHSDTNEAVKVAPMLVDYEGEEPLASIVRLKGVQCLAHSRHVTVEELDNIFPKPPLTPEVSGAFMEAAFELERLGHVGASRSLYERLLATEGLSASFLANVHLRLGIVLDSLMQWEEAIAHYARAAASHEAIGPARSEAAYRLAKARLLHEEYAEAADLFGRIYSDPHLSPSQRGDAQLQFGAALYRDGQVDRARQQLSQLRGTGNELEVKAELLLAEIYESEGNKAAAVDAYQRVLQHPFTEPMTRAAALTRVKRLKR